jgi:hypothetical protein
MDGVVDLFKEAPTSNRSKSAEKGLGGRENVRRHLSRSVDRERASEGERTERERGSEAVRAKESVRQRDRERGKDLLPLIIT